MHDQRGQSPEEGDVEREQAFQIAQVRTCVALHVQIFSASLLHVRWLQVCPLWVKHEKPRLCWVSWAVHVSNIQSGRPHCLEDMEVLPTEKEVDGGSGARRARRSLDSPSRNRQCIRKN